MKTLIADDDPTSRMLMRRLLRNVLGYEVFEATDGLNAWQVLDSGMEVDLCILDIWMPGMNGLELISKMRSDARFKSQKVILCSLENGRNAVVQAASLGISGYLIKPFVSEQFLAKVRKICEGCQTEAARVVLESAEVVLGRLGVGMTTYLDLLNVFTQDVARLVQELQDQPAGGSLCDRETRLGGLCGAGRSLGAEALVAAILRLEKMDATAGPSWVRSCIESLQNENERVISAMKAITAPVEPSQNKPQERNSKLTPPLPPVKSPEEYPGPGKFLLPRRSEAQKPVAMETGSQGAIHRRARAAHRALW
jgi:CheY-like chemotaxis protein